MSEGFPNTIPDRVPWSPDLEPDGPDFPNDDGPQPAYLSHDTPAGYDEPHFPDISIPKKKVNP